MSLPVVSRLVWRRLSSDAVNAVVVDRSTQSLSHSSSLSAEFVVVSRSLQDSGDATSSCRRRLWAGRWAADIYPRTSVRSCGHCCRHLLQQVSDRKHELQYAVSFSDIFLPRDARTSAIYDVVRCLSGVCHFRVLCRNGRPQLLWNANRKPYSSYRMVPIFNDLEWLNEIFNDRKNRVAFCDSWASCQWYIFTTQRRPI